MPTLPLQFYDPEGEPLDSGNVVEITDVVSEGLQRLIPEYQETPRVQAWISSFLKEAQGIETTVFDLWELNLNLDLATSEGLNVIGRILLEARDGRSDDDYRRSLRVRVLVNRSQGRLEELIAIVFLFDDVEGETGAYVRIQDVPNAAIEVRSVRTPINPRGELDKRLRLAKAAGVNLVTMIHPGGPTGSFKFIRVADYPEKNTTEGFSHSTVTGGAFASVLA